MVDGFLSLDDEGRLKYELMHPIGKDGSITEIVFESRISVGELNKRLTEGNGTDFDSRVMAYVRTLTNQPKPILGQIDSNDWTFIQSVAMLFM